MNITKEELYKMKSRMEEALNIINDKLHVAGVSAGVSTPAPDSGRKPLKADEVSKIKNRRLRTIFNK